MAAHSTAALDVPVRPVVRPARLELLDVLRFVAAAMVVCFHWLFNGIAGGKVTSLELTGAASWAKYGYLGVSFFFLISGFVITRSTRGRSARDFVLGRAVRLLPAFWCGVVITSIATLWLGGATMSVTPAAFLANLTMVPPLFGQPFVDGVYWTLVIELQFYLLVFLVILVGLGRRLETLVPCWALVMLVATVVGLGSVPYLGGYMAYFAAGAIISSIQAGGVVSRSTWLLRIGGLLAAYAVAAQHAVGELPAFEAERGTQYATGVVLALVTGFHLVLLAFCWPRLAGLRFRAAAVLGGLTYPVYLLHAHLGYLVLNQADRLGGPLGAYAVALAVVGLLSALLYTVVERRLRGTWYRFFGWAISLVVRVAVAPGRLRQPASRPVLRDLARSSPGG